MRLFILVLLTAGGICIANTFAIAEEDQGVLSSLDIAASETTDIYSKYIWRGFTLDSDMSFQPGFSLSTNGITVSFWSSWDLDNNDSLDGDELDYVVDYTYNFDYADISLGHTYYEFPGSDTFSKEFYGGLAFNNIILMPTFAYYYDYGDEAQGGGDGQYVTFEISHSFLLDKELGIALDLKARTGYNKGLFISGEGGDNLLTFGFTIPLRKRLVLSPTVNYSMPYGDLKDFNDGNQKEKFYYGFSIEMVL